MCDVSSREQAESNTQAASATHRPRPHQRADESARLPASGGEEGGVINCALIFHAKWLHWTGREYIAVIPEGRSLYEFSQERN